MGITTRSDSPSKTSSHSTTKSAPAKKTSEPTKAKVSAEKAPVQGDKVDVKKEGKATAGAQTMASGLAQNFASKPTAVDALKATSQVDPGQAAVDDARKFLGEKSQDVKGQLDNFQAAGGHTNNCADFVSANLMNQGLLEGKQVNVDKLREQLVKEGWSTVDAADAKPGDVAFYNNKRHVELVSEAGGTMSIGSNNQDPVTREPVAGQQYITERPMDPAEVTYYTRPEEVAKP